MTVSDSAGTASAYKIRARGDVDSLAEGGAPADGDKSAFLQATPSPFMHPLPPIGGQAAPVFFDPAYDCQVYDCGLDGQYYGNPYDTGSGYGEVYDPSFSLYMQQGWIAAGFDEMGAGQIPGGGGPRHHMFAEQLLGESGVLQLDGGLNSEQLGSLPADATPEEASSPEPELADVPEEAASSSSGSRSGRRDPAHAGREATKPEASPPEGIRDIASARPGDEASKGAAASGGCTTVMLRNIPNKYTREMLVDQLNKEFRGRFDFMYLPIDFKNKCNVGYGFINFRTAESCSDFVNQFHGVDVRKCLPGLKSNKVVEVTPARVQGLSENVRRLRNSPVMNQLVDHPEWMPMIFSDHGQELFPKPDQPLPPVKPRGRGPLASHAR